MGGFFSNNIRLIREIKGIKQDAFEEIGIKKGTYSNYEIGKTEPNIDTLMNISNFLGLDLNNLISVDLSGLSDDELLKLINSKKNNAYQNAYQYAYPSSKNNDANIEKTLDKVDQVQVHLPDFLSNEELLSVPFYDLPVSAGSLGILDGDSFNTIPPNGHVQIPAFRGCIAAFPIIGISMEPIVHSGDWIGIKTIDNIASSWDFIQTDVIYLIITREDRMIKFIEKASDEDYIICRSPNASPFKVYKGDVLNIYRVKAIARGL